MILRIAIVGDENVSLPSHREINAVRPMLGADVSTEWLATDGHRVADLSGFDGIWLVPGSPYANDDAACATVTWARERDVPFLGSCARLQYAVIEYFRNVLGVPDASHAEADGVGETNVVSALAGKPLHPLLREFVACAREYSGQAVAGAASSSASS